MSLWDRIGKLAKFLTEQPDYKPVAEAGQRVPSAAYRPDALPTARTAAAPAAPRGITRSNYASIHDLARTVPAVPGGWNDSLETLRAGVSRAGENLFGPTLGKAVEVADSKTDGAVSKTLMAGIKGVRSNYAWWRDIEANTSGMGLLAALGMIGAGAAAGVGAAVVGLPAAAVAGSIALGSYAAGKIGREVSETGVVGETAQKAAEFAGTEEGQKKYNFGRDVVGSAAKAVGWEEVAKTDKGIGAITAGLLNFGFEFGATPDIAGGKLLGGIGQRVLKAPIKPAEGGLINKVLEKRNQKLTKQRVAENVDLIDRTVAGEQTRYTPLFDFLENNTAAVVAQRPEFRTVLGNDAAMLLAGRTRQEIGLALKAGYGIPAAIKELSEKHIDLTNEINRLDGALEVSKKNGVYTLDFKGKTLVMSPRFTNNRQAVEAELKVLREKNRWVNDALKLDSELQDRTVSSLPYIEKLRNDLAKERAARKLEMKDTSQRETGLGTAIQTLYQKSPFSPLIRRIDRLTDDAPRNLIVFDDPLASADRVRSGIRAAITTGAILPEEGMRIYNSYLSARTNGEKFLIVESYTKKLAQNLGDIHKVPANRVNVILEEYDKAMRETIGAGIEANAAKRGYMFGPGGIDDIIADPQLITQLANGAFWPDAKQWDKAFKRYAAKKGEDLSTPQSALMMGIEIAEEFNSLWRGFTLLRGGYPTNIIRDSALRIYGDGAAFYTLKELTLEMTEKIARSDNSVTNIANRIKGLGNPNRAEKKFAKQIRLNEVALQGMAKWLKAEGYDVTKPPKKMPKDPLVRDSVTWYNKISDDIKELQRQRNTVLSGKPVKTVGRDKMIQVYGEEFPAAFSGRFADITIQQIGNPDDIRRALSYTQELALQNIKKTRTGTEGLLATTDEALHMNEWVTTLRNAVGFDPVARMIMEGKSRKEVVAWLRSDKGFDYMDQLGYRGIDAPRQYEKVKTLVNLFAPTKAVQELVLNNKVNAAALIKLYPDPATRPPILTDLWRDNAPVGGRMSEAYQAGTDLLKDGVAWLSTRPTAALMFNPYFAVKYNWKLQSMVHIAHVQGRKLTLEDKGRFEAIARRYAIKEYREKLNSFHRDMNYGGLVNYILAFFPAVVEQYRAYGRIAFENPDFLIKASLIAMIPGQYLGAQEDSFGNEYVEVDLPLVGPSDTRYRLPASWFNPFNPTGSASIVSAGPGLSAIGNFVSKKFPTDNAMVEKINNWMLPFGTQEDTGVLLTPNTIKRAAQAFRATLYKSGPQFNKDTQNRMQWLRFEFIKENDREPNGAELAELSEQAMGDAVAMAWGRFVNAGLLPVQPQYVTPLQGHLDILFKMREEDPINGEDRFMDEYPDYFLLASSLSDNTSGLTADATSVNLVKKNPKFIRNVVANIGSDNLSVLGSIFNDDNYAFSSAANAYLKTKNIPGLQKAFKDSASALEAQRSNIVSKGWNDYTKFVEIVTMAIEESKPGRTVASGYGKILFEKYREAYIAQAAEKNKIWYEEFNAPFSAKGAKKREDTIKALTLAANTPELWKDLQKIPRWANVVNYLNFRYDIHDELKSRKVGIDSDRAKDIREDVATFVNQLRKKDIYFGKFYDRYFTNDDFSFVVEGE